jgi:hypothetical protein
MHVSLKKRVLYVASTLKLLTRLWRPAEGPMFTFEKAKDLHVKLAAFYEAGKVAAALWHGVSILPYAMMIRTGVR